MPVLATRLLVVLLMLWPLRLPAAEAMFEALVPVADQSAPERRRATEEGLRQVLVKASGQRAVLAGDALQAEVSRAQELLASFRYEPVPPRAGSTEPAGLRLRLAFDESAVSRLLQRAGAPQWSAARPTVLLWTGSAQSPRAAHAAGTVQGDALLEAAAARALPVQLAAGELAPAALSVADQQAVLARLGARVAVVAGTAPAAGRWRAEGFLGIDGQRQPLEASGADEAAALRELVAQATDLLAARYAVVVQGDRLQGLRLSVAGIDTLQAHAALQEWLVALPLVSDLVVERVAADRVDFLLTLAGEVEQLLDLLALDGRLEGISRSEPRRVDARLRERR